MTKSSQKKLFVVFLPYDNNCKNINFSNKKWIIYEPYRI